MFNIRAAFSVILLLFIAACHGSEQVPNPDIKNLQIKIEAPKRPAFVSDDDRGSKVWKWTKQIYADRQFRPAWTAQRRVFANVDNVMQTFENAPKDGLHRDDISELRAMRETVTASQDPSAPVDFDLHLTYSLVRYAADLCFGRVDSKEIDPTWKSPQKNCDIPAVVSDAINRTSFDTIAEKLSPALLEYKQLRETLQRYREIAAHGGWKPLPADAAKHPDENMPAVAANLHLIGYTDADTGPALRQFESNHGLEASGKLDEKNIRALNVPVQDRIDQIEINLDRLRWLNGEFEPRHIRVNVPAFELSVHDGDEIPLQMKVIVGSDDNRTPIFSGDMQYIVFSPYWNIPLSIVRKELLPKIQKDPKYLDRQQMEVVQMSGKKVETLDPSEIDWDTPAENFNYQLRQKPGGKNSLGLVKFMFPNSFNVYLHDTPADNLFGRLTRTLSHGCIRLERPAELAAYVLADQPEWTSERIEEAMHAQEEKTVPLKTRVPVHILYWTAWVDPQGVTQFRDDVYGYDQKHRSLLTAAANKEY